MNVYSALDIYSINFDYVPTLVNGIKCMYLELKFPPPKDLRIGEGVMIKTTDPNFVPPPGDLYVLDIIGTRVVIAPTLPGPASRVPVVSYQPKNDRPGWNPLDHGDQWGYSTRSALENKTNPNLDRNWVFGSGKPVGVLIW